MGLRVMGRLELAALYGPLDRRDREGPLPLFDPPPAVCGQLDAGVMLLHLQDFWNLPVCYLPFLMRRFPGIYISTCLQEPPAGFLESTCPLATYSF